MTLILPLHSSPFLSIEEWEELQALREAISDAPSSVVPWKMERFSFLFARSLQGKGDGVVLSAGERDIL